jgi:hypothetical protein
MKNTIRLDIIHADKSRVEHFLNNVDQDLEQIPFDARELSGVDVDYWIFGHSHEVVPDFKIGKTTLTTNQMGYVEYGEQSHFSDSKTLSINKETI